MQLQSTSPSFITPSKTLLQPPPPPPPPVIQILLLTTDLFIGFTQSTVSTPPTPTHPHRHKHTHRNPPPRPPPAHTPHPFTARHISSSLLFLSNQTSQHPAVTLTSDRTTRLKMKIKTFYTQNNLRIMLSLNPTRLTSDHDL